MGQLYDIVIKDTRVPGHVLYQDTRAPARSVANILNSMMGYNHITHVHVRSAMRSGLPTEFTHTLNKAIVMEVSVTQTEDSEQVLRGVGVRVDLPDISQIAFDLEEYDIITGHTSFTDYGVDLASVLQTLEIRMELTYRQARESVDLALMVGPYSFRHPSVRSRSMRITAKRKDEEQRFNVSVKNFATGATEVEQAGLTKKEAVTVLSVRLGLLPKEVTLYVEEVAKGGGKRPYYSRTGQFEAGVSIFQPEEQKGDVQQFSMSVKYYDDGETYFEDRYMPEDKLRRVLLNSLRLSAEQIDALVVLAKGERTGYHATLSNGRRVIITMEAR